MEEHSGPMVHTIFFKNYTYDEGYSQNGEVQLLLEWSGDLLERLGNWNIWFAALDIPNPPQGKFREVAGELLG